MDAHLENAGGPDVREPRPEAAGAAAGWRRLHSEILYQDRFQQLRRDRVSLETPGAPPREIDFAYQERPPGVLVVPVTPDGDVLLVWQYRYAIDSWGLEVPAGGTQDTGDLPLEVVARKELREEVGAEAGEVRAVGWFWTDGALTDQVCHVFLALDVRRCEKPQREPTEASMEIRAVPIAEALRLARTGGIRIGPSALAILQCEPHLTTPPRNTSNGR